METIDIGVWPSDKFPGQYNGKVAEINGQKYYVNMYNNIPKIESGEWLPTSPHFKIRLKPVQGEGTPPAAWQRPVEHTQSGIPF